LFQFTIRCHKNSGENNVNSRRNDLVLRNYGKITTNEVDVPHVGLNELHAAHQNLPPAIRTHRLKETIQNIHQKRTKSDNMIRT